MPEKEHSWYTSWHCVPVCHCVLVLLPIPCANSWELSAKVDVEVVVHDMIYLAHDNLHAACWFSHSKGINSSSKYGWEQTFPTGSPICTNFEFRSIAAKVWCRCLFCPSVLAVSPAFSTLTVDCRSAALSAASSVDLLAADAVIVLNPIQ